jgi:hypothetical protein
MQGARVFYGDVISADDRSSAERLSGEAAAQMETFEDAAPLTGVAWLWEQVPESVDLRSRLDEVEAGKEFRSAVRRQLLFRWESRVRWRSAERCYRAALRSFQEECAADGVPMEERHARQVLAQYTRRQNRG